MIIKTLGKIRRRMIILTIVFCILLIIPTTLAIKNYIQLKDSDWICIAQECDKEVSGDEWVSWFCRPKTINDITELYCEVKMNDQIVQIPLSAINTTNIKGCVEYECVTEGIFRGVLKEDWRRE